MSLPPVGAQLIVFGRSKYDLNTDPDTLLSGLKKAGYAGIEGGAKDPDALRRKLDEHGMKLGGSHTGTGALKDVAPFIKNLKIFGCTDLCCSGLIDWNKRGAQDYADTIRLLNDAGRKLRDQGIGLHYHNHDFEFAEKVDGKRGIDILLDGMKPEACDLCVDVAWVMRGGDDPAKFLLSHADRIGFLHFKDYDGTNWAELGRGKVDWKSVMAALPKVTKAGWVMIEQDSTQIDPMESMTISRRFLKKEFNY